MTKKNIVQEKSYQFVVKILQFVKQFPRQTEGFVIGTQLMKSGTSIGANIEEAIGAFSKEDFTYKMNIALKEARETHYWLRLIRDSKSIKIETESLIKECSEMVKILTSIVKTSQGKPRNECHS